MVLSYEEELKLQNLKQEHKTELLIMQHDFTMQELNMQMKIEAIRASTMPHLDPSEKERFYRMAFNIHGQEEENVK